MPFAHMNCMVLLLTCVYSMTLQSASVLKAVSTETAASDLADFDAEIAGIVGEFSQDSTTERDWTESLKRRQQEGEIEKTLAFRFTVADQLIHGGSLKETQDRLKRLSRAAADPNLKIVDGYYYTHHIPATEKDSVPDTVELSGGIIKGGLIEGAELRCMRAAVSTDGTSTPTTQTHCLARTPHNFFITVPKHLFETAQTCAQQAGKTLKFHAAYTKTPEMLAFKTQAFQELFCAMAAEQPLAERNTWHTSFMSLSYEELCELMDQFVIHAAIPAPVILSDAHLPSSMTPYVEQSKKLQSALRALHKKASALAKQGTPHSAEQLTAIAKKEEKLQQRFVNIMLKLNDAPGTLTEFVCDIPDHPGARLLQCERNLGGAGLITGRLIIDFANPLAPVMGGIKVITHDQDDEEGGPQFVPEIQNVNGDDIALLFDIGNDQFIQVKQSTPPFSSDKGLFPEENAALKVIGALTMLQNYFAMVKRAPQFDKLALENAGPEEQKTNLERLKDTFEKEDQQFNTRLLKPLYHAVYHKRPELWSVTKSFLADRQRHQVLKKK